MALLGIVSLVNSRKKLFESSKPALLVIGFLLFWFCGSYMFLLLEGPEYEKSQQKVLNARKRVLDRFGEESGKIVDAFLDAMRDEDVHTLPNKNGTVRPWRLADASFFVVTLLTTVGYGHFAPKTILGKIACIIYTAMGIPITLFTLAYHVEQLLKLSEKYKAFLFRILQWRLRPFTIRLLHVCSVMAIIVMVCFILPALVFIQYEKGWSVFDGIYFCFISLTTVGLGDMVPAMNPELVNTDLYKVCASVYLIVGVTIIMFMMAMWGDFFRNYNKGYETLPFTILNEKVPINPGSVLTYGSIITQSGGISATEKLIT